MGCIGIRHAGNTEQKDYSEGSDIMCFQGDTPFCKEEKGSLPSVAMLIFDFCDWAHAIPVEEITRQEQRDLGQGAVGVAACKEDDAGSQTATLSDSQ